MSKVKTLYICQSCGWSAPRWQGQCGQCSEWNTMVEEVVSGGGGPAHAAIARATVISAAEVSQTQTHSKRLSTGISEFDRVLGGDEAQMGMVYGGVYLIGGEPGIGKSTLLTQMVLNILAQATAAKKRTILYVCGEENPSQIYLRIKRLSNNDQINLDALKFTISTDVQQIVALIDQSKPDVVIVDSIQTITSPELSGVAGSVGQIREATDALTRAAKTYNVPTFLVGHVTKEGVISGPKILEHIVDSVLELSGERTSDVRILRAIKNRFGATDEVGVFQVTEQGYVEILNPSTFFIDAEQGPTPGSAIVCVIEGTRPILIEVQALVVSSPLPSPRRVGRGVDVSKIQVLAAVLQKHCGYALANYDIFVSVAGGFTIKEPAADLGIALAMASSLSNKPIPIGTLAIGEVGLLGEVRTVSLGERRIKEAKRLGYKRILSRKEYKNVSLVFSALGLQRH